MGWKAHATEDTGCKPVPREVHGLGSPCHARNPELSTAEQARLPEWMNKPCLRVRTTRKARAG